MIKISVKQILDKKNIICNEMVTKLHKICTIKVTLRFRLFVFLLAENSDDFSFVAMTINYLGGELGS